MKGTVKYCLAVAFLLITGCGDGSNESAGSRADGSNGTAVISVNGVEIEITSVSCRAQDSTYSVRASGPTHSVEVEYSLIRGEGEEKTFDFSRAAHLEVYAYREDETVLYRPGAFDPPHNITGSEAHSTGSADLARYSDEKDRISVDLDIRCGG
ncbi:MAG TPA: hypothetical protein VK040_09165 [Balneolaceae bacterium]|nr:hypothetical protein [Balneolaceae bacterium]